MDKSYVSMEMRVCVVCGKEYETNSILLDRRLKESMDRFTVTGWGMCKEHQKLKDEGYVALIGCDKTKMQGVMENDTVKPGDAYRTGSLIHVRSAVFSKIFNGEPPPKGIIFCEEEVIEKLKKMQGGVDGRKS